MKFKSLLKIGILGMHRYFNVRKSFYIVDHIKKVKRENSIIIPLDPENAFHKICILFMIISLATRNIKKLSCTTNI